MKKSGISWSDIPSLFLQLVLFLFLILMAIVTIKGLKTTGYSVHSFQLPKHLEESGLNGQVFATRLKDQIENIKIEVRTTKEDSNRFEAELKPDLNLEVLGVGFSTNNLLYHVGDLLGIKNKAITGDLVDLDNTLRLSIRGTNIPTQNIIQDHHDIRLSDAVDSLVLKASLSILMQIDPYRLSVYYYRQESKEQCLAIVREMIAKQHPDIAWAYLMWGILNLKENDLKEAITLLKKTVELDPTIAQGHINLGWSYAKKEEYLLAIESFERGRSIRSSFSINNGLGYCYIRTGQVDQAEAAYQRNVNEFGDNLWSYGNYAEFILNHRKDSVKAASLFKLASKKVQQNADYFNSLSGYYLLAKEYDSSFMMIQQALEYDPSSVSALQIASQFMISHKKDYQEAEGYLRRYIAALQEGEYETGMIQSGYNSLAMNDYSLLKYDSALVHIRKAIDLDPTSMYPYTTLAETYGFMGNKTLFYQALKEAVDLGFNLKTYQDEAPYSKYKHETRFKEMLVDRILD